MKTTNGLLFFALRFSFFFFSSFLSFFLREADAQAPVADTLVADAGATFQRIDGFGVNANTRSWEGDQLKPAIDLLIDSLHATIWRVIVEPVEKWEDVNDNADPFSLNHKYYDSLYETPKFRKAWAMIRYLNDRGITRNLMINVMGTIPKWMGGEKILPQYEDEFAEMEYSFFDYAVRVKHLQIGLVSIMNEPDIKKEGPTVDALQYARVLRKVMDRMTAPGLSEIRFVAPDVAGTDHGVKAYIPALMKDTALVTRIAHWGLHTYSGPDRAIDSTLTHSNYPEISYWVTEWNAWRDGLDDGKVGVYDFTFARDCMRHLLGLLNHGATAALIWEAYDSYYEHHAPSLFSYWGILGYDPAGKKYPPRKHLYALEQLFRFVAGGAHRIHIGTSHTGMPVVAFADTAGSVTIVGINVSATPVNLSLQVKNLAGLGKLRLYHTGETADMVRDPEITKTGGAFAITVPANCLFTLSGKTAPVVLAPLPEPAGWYTGDIHVHRNCGDGTGVTSMDQFPAMMERNRLSVISLLADIGNGEVKFAPTDMPHVNGNDDSLSATNRLIHWDAEWHWDATYSNFSHQALGGHLVLLGLKEAHQIWDESLYKVLDWAHGQDAVAGFAHFEYLKDTFQNDLNCCIPVEYPVEAALGKIDFVSEDVFGTTSPNNGNYNSEAVMQAYYKLLNCGFRIALAAGTDFPCNDFEPLGALLTYVDVGKEPLTYDRWIRGLKAGRTVVTRDGHDEFLDFRVGGNAGPGDELSLAKGKPVTCTVTWTAAKPYTGTIELVCNGKVIASKSGTASPGRPVVFSFNQPVSASSWICARRMGPDGHTVHTGPVYLTVNKKPVRASAADARYFSDWIGTVLQKTAPGGPWSIYFTHDQETVRARYQQARHIFEKIYHESTSR